jgi:RimJ/RimL family protein N-acetyltransferase
VPIPQEQCSQRICIRPAKPEQLRAELGLEYRVEFQAAMACEVMGDWPPLYWDATAVKWLLAKAAEFPDEPLWGAWYVLLRGVGGGGRDLLVGTVGCKGPPVDEGGRQVVEIGYGVVTSRWRRGIASEAVGLMLGWLRSLGRVTHVRAHTLEGDPASGGVLRKNGFELVGKATEDGMVVDRWERSL